MLVVFFSAELERFIRDLEKPIIAKVLRTIDLLEQFGNRLGMPHSKPVGHRIFELRVRGAQEVRILYAFQGGRAVLLHGYIKKSAGLPSRELRRAIRNLSLLDRP